MELAQPRSYTSILIEDLQEVHPIVFRYFNFPFDDG